MNNLIKCLSVSNDDNDGDQWPMTICVAMKNSGADRSWYSIVITRTETTFDKEKK